MALVIKTLDLARADFMEQQVLAQKASAKRYAMFCREINSRQEYEKFSTLTGLPLPGQVDEGQLVPEGTPRKLYNKSWQVSKYGQRIKYTYEAQFTDQFSVFETLGKQAGQRAEQNLEFLFASFLANAWNSGSDYLGADGVSFASTAHPTNGGPTFSNTSSNLSLNPVNLNAAKTQVRKVLDANGVPFDYTGEWTLVTPVDLEYTADEILNSTGLAYSTDNTKATQKTYMAGNSVTLPFWNSTTTAWALFPTNKDEHGVFKMNRMPRKTEFDTDKQHQAEFIIVTEENVIGWLHSYNTYMNQGS